MRARQLVATVDGEGLRVQLCQGARIERLTVLKPPNLASSRLSLLSALASTAATLAESDAECRTRLGSRSIRGPDSHEASKDEDWMLDLQAAVSAPSGRDTCPLADQAMSLFNSRRK